jgi:tetraacyldisaccharide 4'-kinase
VVNLDDETLRRPLTDFIGLKVCAVAAIGHPGRFFADLRAAGLCAEEERAFPDHHRFKPEDLGLDDGVEIVMTEKDAVKCRGFASGRLWRVPLQAQLPPAFGERLLQLLKAKRDGQKTA